MSTKESSLTSPMDRDVENKWRPTPAAPVLTDAEFKDAAAELEITSYVSKFPVVERRYADPPVELQRYGLISWVPAKGAKPNENGIYGFAKIRGNYNTQTEASERAEFLIRNVDSYHKIYHAYVGRPFPLTTSSDFSGETEEIDIRKSMAESVSASIKKQKDEEKKAVEEVKEREKKLLDDVKPDKEEDPYETYTTLRVKYSQVAWTYVETEKKLKEMQDIIRKTRREIDKMDAENKDYKDKYLGKYKAARKEAGLSDDKMQDNFMKFLVEDVEFDFLKDNDNDKENVPSV